MSCFSGFLYKRKPEKTDGGQRMVDGDKLGSILLPLSFIQFLNQLPIP